MEFFSSLLKSVDLSIDATMQDLYNYNGIDIHVYMTELNSFTLVDVSYKTHPDWRIIDVVHASCAIPIVFTPYMHENNCYIDGGFFMNYPISKCLELVENHNEILGISLGNNGKATLNVNSVSSIFDLINVLLNRIINNVEFFTNDKTANIPYEIHVDSNPTTLEYCLNVLYNKEDRQTLIIDGINIMKEKMTTWISMRH